MNAKNKILITGATGNTGSELLKILKANNIPAIAAIRHPNPSNKILKEDTECVVFDFKNAQCYPAALSQVKRIFLVRPPEISDVKKYIFPFIDAAVKSGVEHIVFLSLMGVEENPITPHYKIEKYILAKNIAYTFIRPSFFMQNLSTTHRMDIQIRREIFLPAGKGKTSFIDTRDIASVAAVTLKDNSHYYKSYELSGSEALSYYQAAEIFTEELGKKITYSNPSIFSFFLRMRKRKIPTGFIVVMIALYTVSKLGLAGKMTDTIKVLLGRDPISFRQFVKDHIEYWL